MRKDLTQKIISLIRGNFFKKIVSELQENSLAVGSTGWAGALWRNINRAGK